MRWGNDPMCKKLTHYKGVKIRTNVSVMLVNCDKSLTNILTNGVK